MVMKPIFCTSPFFITNLPKNDILQYLLDSCTKKRGKMDVQVFDMLIVECDWRKEISSRLCRCIENDQQQFSVEHAWKMRLLCHIGCLDCHQAATSPCDRRRMPRGDARLMCLIYGSPPTPTHPGNGLGCELSTPQLYHSFPLPLLPRENILKSLAKLP